MCEVLDAHIGVCMYVCACMCMHVHVVRPSCHRIVIVHVRTFVLIQSCPGVGHLAGVLSLAVSAELGLSAWAVWRDVPAAPPSLYPQHPRSGDHAPHQGGHSREGAAVGMPVALVFCQHGAAAEPWLPTPHEGPAEQGMCRKTHGHT